MTAEREGPESGEVAALLAATAGGDRAAFQRLYEKTSPTLLGSLVRILRDRALAEDALQEVYIQVWNRAGQFEAARGSAWAWLVSIARYRAIDLRRRESRRPGGGDFELETVAAESEPHEGLMSLGLSETDLRRMTKPSEGRFFAVADLPALPVVCATRLASWALESHGLAVVELPTASGIAADYSTIARAQRESSEAVTCSLEALAAGHIGRAKAADLERECDEAIAAFREGIRINPDIAQGHGNLGVALFRKGDFAGAVESLRKAAELDPAFRSLDGMRADAERLAPARARLEAVLRGEDRPKSAEEWALFAEVSYWTRDYVSSVRLYKEAFADPEIMTPMPKHDVPQGVLVPAQVDNPAPRAWGDRHLQNLVHWTEAGRGGHFPRHGGAGAAGCRHPGIL